MKHTNRQTYTVHYEGCSFLLMINVSLKNYFLFPFSSLLFLLILFSALHLFIIRYETCKILLYLRLVLCLHQVSVLVRNTKMGSFLEFKVGVES